MSEETIKNMLKEFGLTDTESEIYLFLSRRGTSKGTEIAKQIGKDKAQIYHILKSLQTKGLVESTLQSPIQFSPVPFEQVVELAIKVKQDEATHIQNTKEELLTYWRTLNKNKLELPLEKFVVLDGRQRIYSKIAQMINSTHNEFSTIFPIEILLNAASHGLYDVGLKHPLKNQITFRFLTNINRGKGKTITKLLKSMSQSGFSFKCKIPNLGENLFPQMVIRDNVEALFFISKRDFNGSKNYHDTCIWTNSAAHSSSIHFCF